jgi:hypothetical protein
VPIKDIAATLREHREPTGIVANADGTVVGVATAADRAGSAQM